MLLATMKEGESARLLGFFAPKKTHGFYISRGMSPGVRVHILRRYADTLVVRFDSVVFAIGIELAMSIKVVADE